MNDPLLTPKEAGAQLRKNEKTVRVMCAGGEIRHVLFGTKLQPRYFIPQSAIDEYLRAHTVPRRGRGTR